MDNRERFIELLRGTERDGIEEAIKIILATKTSKIK